MSDIIRRDPRAEWIARNRLHPLHAEMAAPAAETRGPSGLIRKNPHAVGFIGPNGIKRIDRSGGSGAAVGIRRGARSAQQVELPLHTVENPDYYVVAVLDMVGGRLTSHDKDVLGQAHKLIRGGDGSGAVLAVVFGEHKEEAFDKAGVDRLLHLTGSEFDGYCPEQKVACLAEVEKQYQPRYWLFPDSINGGNELGCRLAARLGERPATQAWQVDRDTSVCRGGGGLSDITRDTPRLLLLAEECADPIDETRHQVLALELDRKPRIINRLQDCGQVAVDPNSVSLAEAEFILSAGNGIHDWDQFHQAAEALGATEGASRVAVDDGFMPRFRQVGATGTWVTARVYVAVGISGAVQHMQGIGQCDKVVAINTDAGCDMVKRADLSIIGDSQKVLAQLIELARDYREGGAENAA
ncbi:electron transfer flavoprotein subunit alpha [Marinobacterium nitratireducens]|uniref:Electron transfer flavoprotein subunit alpha n=1 Tax=Marinobacterium nitratireducens TaxID=518897 RepID=A0A917ZLK0_9GAMM|nr:electron transfer flavoprotein subunit alpha/FixB family protein [Marinobacterium nitratireducens]GGO84677.1 electron transfer flavoprotein subunit alpha [Marinobacterium nitratireducens]